MNTYLSFHLFTIIITILFVIACISIRLHAITILPLLLDYHITTYIILILAHCSYITIPIGITKFVVIVVLSHYYYYFYYYYHIFIIITTTNDKTATKNKNNKTTTKQQNNTSINIY